MTTGVEYVYRIPLLLQHRLGWRSIPQEYISASEQLTLISPCTHSYTSLSQNVEQNVRRRKTDAERAANLCTSMICVLQRKEFEVLRIPKENTNGDEETTVAGPDNENDASLPNETAMSLSETRAD